MKQIEKDMICYYCLGCNRLTQEQFEGVRNCKQFAPDKEEWREKLIGAMKGEQKRK